MNRTCGTLQRSRDEFISDVLLCTPSHGRTKAGQPARTYRQQFCADTGCNPEDLPEIMDEREGWQERVRDIHAADVDDNLSIIQNRTVCQVKLNLSFCLLI